MVSFGFPRDIESHIQETGRAGHDNLPSLETLIRKPTSGESSREYATNKAIVEEMCYFLTLVDMNAFSFSLLCSKLCDCN